MTFRFSTETVIATQREHSRDIGRRSMNFQYRINAPNRATQIGDFVRDSNGTWCVFSFAICLANATYRRKT
ncbi:hypothetical protein GHT06_008056 [Daphnia sinensis]|uniref:Uncharacterized protein n=1 Tax=Daphnia sinensis TaxID=1820382 RepID=A0AAD5LUK6_9CRUS|nr:hypothetical protein GHT06_008056 [Daphnia sinensis]